MKASVNSVVYIHNSIFSDNFATQGAAFGITRTSSIKVFNSTFTSNTAMTSGVLDIDQECQASISSSNFYANRAERGTSVLRYNKAVTDSNSVVNCRFEANVAKQITISIQST